MTSRNIKKHLQTVDIAEGLQHRSDCPECGGKNTFTATKDMGLVIYNCYKLGCSVRGVSVEGLTAHEIHDRLHPRDTHPSSPVLDTYVWPEYVVQPSPEHVLHRKFVSRWGLENEDLMYDVKDRRSVFPIRYNGQLIDAVGRALDGATPKWYRYTGHTDVYKRTVGKPSGVALVVEDVISAVTAAQVVPGLTGLAILGTALSAGMMQHIDGYYKVIIALDPDAAHKTLLYKREVEAWTGLDTKALRLEDDLKYKRETDMERLKEVVCTWM